MSKDELLHLKATEIVTLLRDKHHVTGVEQLDIESSLRSSFIKLASLSPDQIIHRCQSPSWFVRLVIKQYIADKYIADKNAICDAILDVGGRCTVEEIAVLLSK